jgi:hypothetical protein
MQLEHRDQMNIADSVEKMSFGANVLGWDVYTVQVNQEDRVIIAVDVLRPHVNREDSILRIVDQVSVQKCESCTSFGYIIRTLLQQAHCACR